MVEHAATMTRRWSDSQASVERTITSGIFYRSAGPGERERQFALFVQGNERLDDRRVEGAARLLLHHLDDFVDASAVAIRAIRAERVEKVGDRQNPAKQRDAARP